MTSGTDKPRGVGRLDAVFVLVLPAAATSPRRARDAVRSMVTRPAVADRPVLAVSEAVSNAVAHAYRTGDAGSVRVFGDLAGGVLTLIVEDDGAGLVPRPDSPGPGLGLPVIATVADRLAIDSTAAGTRSTT